mgnify:CR=1 FL=1
MYAQRVGKMGKYKEERASYLNSLMESDTRKAVALVGNFLQSDIPLPDICVDILGKIHGGSGRTMA